MEDTTGEPTPRGVEDDDLPPMQKREPVSVLSDGRPDPKWVRGKCPECGDDLISNLYYVGGKGYVIMWECWGGMGDPPTCTYRRRL